jgi:hypothetical protein
MSRETVTHVASAVVAAVAFWWRWESPKKRWTKERWAVLGGTAFATLWNLYCAVWRP